MDNVRLIAFYLPQFHPIPENDTWWGRGFTEWTNVAKALPQYPGHYQPHIPADLGFYDLRLPAARLAQTELTSRYGIHGFCYYHYWFNGRRLLNQPIDAVLESGEPDFPFCFCWPNENWTRTWDGAEQQILIEQHYSAGDDLNHIRWLARAFRDPRYIRVNGKPLFLIYRSARLPDVNRTISIWREEARKMGIGELYLCRVESSRKERSDPRPSGFDAAVEFQPDWTLLTSPMPYAWQDRLRSRLRLRPYRRVHQLFDYDGLVERSLRKGSPSYLRFPCVLPSWDNTARRGENAIVLFGSSPEKYEEWLKKSVAAVAHRSPDERIVFINAWNEWAEGNHLEPDLQYGHAYLEATRNALRSFESYACDRRHLHLESRPVAGVYPDPAARVAHPGGHRLGTADRQ